MTVEALRSTRGQAFHFLTQRSKRAMRLHADADREASHLNIYTPIRTMVVSDHPLVRHGLRHALRNSKVLKCVVDVECLSAGCISMAREHKAELVIVDIVQPIRNALACIRLLHEAHPGVRILAIATHPEWLLGVRAMRAGANGFAQKSEAVADLVTAAEMTAQGLGYITQDALTQWLRLASDRNIMPVERLSDCELDVLYYLADGVPIGQVKDRLKLTDKALRNYKTRLLRKLGKDGQMDLARYVVEHGLIAAV